MTNDKKEELKITFNWETTHHSNLRRTKKWMWKMSVGIRDQWIQSISNKSGQQNWYGALLSSYIRQLITWLWKHNSRRNSRKQQLSKRNLNTLLRQLSSGSNNTICLVGDFNYSTIDWTRWTSPHLKRVKKRSSSKAWEMPTFSNM